MKILSFIVNAIVPDLGNLASASLPRYKRNHSLILGALVFLLTACVNQNSSNQQQPSSLAPTLSSEIRSTVVVEKPAIPMPELRPTQAQLSSISPCQTHELTAPTSASQSINIVYDQKRQAIVLLEGATTLGSLQASLEQLGGLDILSDGAWLLKRNLIIEQGASLTISGAEFPRLLLKSDSDGFIWIKALGGNLSIEDACLSSWDKNNQNVDTNYDDGRSFILARDGARMNIRRSDISYLGYMADESYGLAWRLEGTSGELLDSRLSYNYYGMYLYSVSGMQIRGNEVHHNILYGIDPHTRSNHLLIENNIAHHNGKQGIILAEDCEDSVIRNNTSYSNGIHGIVVYQHSNRAIVEGNISYDNGSQGINVNNSQAVIVRNNQVFANQEDGIGIGQEASDATVTGNLVSSNARDGITIYSDATNNTISANEVHGNGRYGIYVKSKGNRVLENSVADNLKQNIVEP